MVLTLKVGPEGHLPLMAGGGDQPGESNPELDALLEDDGYTSGRSATHSLRSG